MRAGKALREQWADDARYAARLRDPIAREADERETAARAHRDAVLDRYGAILLAAMQSGKLEAADLVTRFDAARERTYQRMRTS